MEKVSLPIKTKIAARMIILIGGILGPFLGISLFKIAESEWGSELGAFFALLLGWPTSLVASLLYFIPGLFLLFKRKKWAYWVSLCSTPLVGFSGTWVMGVFLVEISSFPPRLFVGISSVYFLAIFVLLLLDRKNFWKITT